MSNTSLVCRVQYYEMLARHGASGTKNIAAKQNIRTGISNSAQPGSMGYTWVVCALTKMS